MTHSVRKLNRLELVGETMRAALNELATVEPEWLAEIVPDEKWYERYGRRVEDYQLPKSKAKRDAWAQSVGEDAYYLLISLEASTLYGWEQLPSIQALKTTLERHYEFIDDGPLPQVRWKSKKELPRAKSGIESPYDVDARFRSRRGVNWVGYAVHLSETCEDEQCHLITHVETTDASVHEAQRTEAIHQSLLSKGLPPSEHFVDSAYVSGEHLVNAKEQQIEIVGPTRQNASWQAKTEGAYDEAQFDIDWSQERVTCPKGKHSQSWKTRVQEGGRTYIQVRFSTRDCGTCSAKELCTKGVQRSLAFLPQAEYKALEQTREMHRSEAGQERYKRRAGIEGTISQGVRGFGLRRSRYRGLAKTHLQNVAIGAAINIDRLVNWINGIPLEKTRVSRFKALEVA